MNLLISFFRLIRIYNLLIMLATQVLAYYYLTDYLIVEDLIRLKFIALVIATLLAGASGYIINDYIDVKIDITNKPDKVIVGNVIPRRWAMLFHLAFNVIAFLLGLLIDWKVALAVVFCAIALWFYSVVFKRQFLLGNLLIAALSAFVLLILRLYDHSVSGYLVWVYALFAFYISLLREIIKDAEDLRGDSRFDCKTLPIILGIRKTKSILVSLTSIFIGLLFVHVFISSGKIPFRHSYSSIIYIFYMVMFVIAPLCGMVYLLRTADVKRDFTRLSAFAKIIMLLGLLSMIVIKI
jgi:4-hydroxybenzoate polyprenyltransferase